MANFDTDAHELYQKKQKYCDIKSPFSNYE